jgi:hypothetical protein
MQNSSDRTDSMCPVGHCSTVRFGTGPVKGHCPESLSWGSAKGPATTIVVIAAMQPRLPLLSTIQAMTKAIIADETTISFKDRRTTCCGPTVEFALWIGCRAGEVPALESTRVDLNGKVAWLGTTKSEDD